MALLYHGIVVRISFKVSELLSAIVLSSRLSPCLSLQAGNLRCCRQHEHLKVIRNFKHLPLGQHRPRIELQDRRITHAVSGNITVRCRAPTYTTAQHHTPPHTMAPPSVPNHSGEPPSFFSLPRELRDEIYDILHQHEEELSRGQLTFRCPLTHLRHISRRFTTESDLRAPPGSRLVISQSCKNWLQMNTLRTRRPRRALLGVGRHCNSLEFNINVCGEGLAVDFQSLELFLSFTYPHLIRSFIYMDARLSSRFRQGGVHLRLFPKSTSYIEPIKHHISVSTREGEYAYCDEISLMVYHKGDEIPDNDSLSRAHIEIVWNKDLGWSDSRVTSG
jgi:hypothetical protein